MSFGMGVGDFIAVGELCWKVYKRCKDSLGSYKELATEVGALRNVVKETEELLFQQELTTEQKGSLESSRLGCLDVLKELDALLTKYESLGTKSQRTWDRMGYATHDVNDIRTRLISNVTLLDAFNNASSHTRLEKKLNILIAEVRAGKREGSIISNTSIDSISRNDQMVWEELRRELEDVGISSAVIKENKQFIVTWFQEVVALGKLEEDAPDSDDDSDDDDSRSNATLSNETDGVINYEVGVLSFNQAKEGQAAIPLGKLHESAPEEDDDAATNPTLQSATDVITDSERETLSIDHEAGEGVVLRRSHTIDSSELVGHEHRLEKTAAGSSSRIQRAMSQRSRLSVSHLLGKLRSKEALLLRAIDSGKEEDAMEMLAKGASVHALDTDSKTPLHCASKIGLAGLLGNLLQKGAAIEARDDVGRTPLHWACSNGHEGMVKALLVAGANIEAKDDDEGTPLHHACSEGRERIIKALFNAGTNIEAQSKFGQTPLISAASSMYEDCIRLLIRIGANVRAKDRLYRTTALHGGEIKWFQDPECVQLLLSGGADVNVKDSSGRTPLHKAIDSLQYVYNPKTKLCIDKILESGADVNAQEFERNQTPLHRAVPPQRWSTKSELITLLFQHGAKANARDSSGITPLLSACGSTIFRPNLKDLMETLLKSGADVNASDRWGRTSLHLALSHHGDPAFLDCLTLLLAYGANVRAKDENGRTPLDDAVYYAASPQTKHRDEARRGYATLLKYF